MKHIYYLWALCCLTPFIAPAQNVQTPCPLQLNISEGLCFDIACIYLQGKPTNGNPPYQYQWSNGIVGNEVYLTPPDSANPELCISLLVTDATGCQAVKTLFFKYPATIGFHIDSLTLEPDTLRFTNNPVVFDLGVNDHPLAQNYSVFKAPAHGVIQLNTDGTGLFTPEPGYCGPDYFQYLATDSTGCQNGPLGLVTLLPESCGGIYLEKPDCNQSCSGKAAFYQNGLLTQPFTYAWSNGSTQAAAEGLCEGPLSVTITDGMGSQQVFSTTVPAESLTADIQAPSALCNHSLIQLIGAITTSAPEIPVWYWAGTSIYGTLAFMENPQLYCHSDSGKASYTLTTQTKSGCLVSTNVEIPVSPTPVIKTIAQAPACPGDTLSIKSFITQPSAPPYHYAWSGPHGVQSNWPDLIWPDARKEHDGYYALTVTDINGCSAVRNQSIFISDTCGIRVTILHDQLVYCSGSDIPLIFGMSPVYVLADEITWTGPNGFLSGEVKPVLLDADPSMSGWYHITLRLGNNLLRDSALFTISPATLAVNQVNITPHTTCFLPYNGIATINMAIAPPFEYKTPNVGSYINVNTNPFNVSNFPPGNSYVDIRKGGCVTRLPLITALPSPPIIEMHSETCAGSDAQIAIQTQHQNNMTWTLPDGSTLNGGPDTLSNLTPGRYLLWFRDLTTNCQFRDTFTLLPYLDVAFSVLDTPSCLTTDGTLLAIPSNTVTQPVSYQWNTGSNQNPLSGLAPGGYSVTATDGNGCTGHKNTVLPPLEACISQVSGQIRANLSCLCNTDSTYVIYPFAKVCATDGQHTTCTYADYAGNYVLGLTEPGDYQITASTYKPGIEEVCVSTPLTIGPDVTRDTAGLDFYFCGTAGSDREIMMYCGPARPGFAFYSEIVVRNLGFWNADTTLVVVQLDSLILNPVFSVPPFIYDPFNHQATWILKELKLFETRKIEIRGAVDINAPMGGTITISSTASGNAPVDPWLPNNQTSCSTIITNSFDPNDKQVSPMGVGQSGAIAPSDSILTYTIRFQNTGTDTAFTVVLRDTLDKEVFDLGSIEPLMSSHPYRLELEQNNILVFTFNPIFLPDSSTSQAGSNGFVMFRIRLLEGLASGTAIRNKAAIYFDYNEPVITNTAGNTLVAIHDPVVTGIKATLQPNPASEWTILSVQNNPEVTRLHITLFNSDGRPVREVYDALQAPATLYLPINTNGLPAGVSFLELRSNTGRLVLKLVVVN